nr:hypothetical protein [Sicyoidochytrium minutum DNA virus]
MLPLKSCRLVCSRVIDRRFPKRKIKEYISQKPKPRPPPEKSTDKKKKTK